MAFSISFSSKLSRLLNIKITALLSFLSSSPHLGLLEVATETITSNKGNLDNIY